MGYLTSKTRSRVFSNGILYKKIIDQTKPQGSLVDYEKPIRINYDNDRKVLEDIIMGQGLKIGKIENTIYSDDGIEFKEDDKILLNENLGSTGFKDLSRRIKKVTPVKNPNSNFRSAGRKNQDNYSRKIIELK